MKTRWRTRLRSRRCWSRRRTACRLKYRGCFRTSTPIVSPAYGRHPAPATCHPALAIMFFRAQPRDLKRPAHDHSHHLRPRPATPTPSPSPVGEGWGEGQTTTHYLVVPGTPGTHGAGTGRGNNTLPRLSGLDPVPTVGRGRAWHSPSTNHIRPKTWRGIKVPDRHQGRRMRRRR